MNPEDSASAPAAGSPVRWFLVGLPLGLLVMGALSFVIYFQKRHAKELAASSPSRYAAMLRKDLNLDDYRRYIRIFEKEIGPRTPDRPENIEAAQSFIESTLGFGNMGYQVIRREAELDGKAPVFFEVELNGRSPGADTQLITARYDGAPGKDIAALLCLANAFTGTVHGGTIRFVAWFDGGESGGKFQLDRYLQRLPDTPKSPVRYLELNGPDPEGKDALGALQALETRIKTLAGDRAGEPAPAR